MRHTHQLAQVGIVAIFCTFTAQINAEPSPYFLGVSQGITHESNIFRAPSGQPKSSDTYLTTSLLAGLDQPIGRQRVYLNGDVRYNKYNDNSQLDNTGFGLNAGLDWSTAGRLSGAFTYNLNQNLASYGADQGPTITKRNLERTQQLQAKAQLGLVSLLSLEGALTHRRIDYSASEFDYQEFSQNSASLGVIYRPSGILNLGAAVRYTHGKYPSAVEPTPGVFQEDKFDRNDFDLTALWIPTGLSKVTARLSFTNEDHTQLKSKDLNGVTGALGWEYKPTGKLTFFTDLIRDTGAEGGFNQGSAATPAGNLSRLSDSIQVRGLFDATAKIQLESTLRYVRRELVSTFALADGASSTEAGKDRYGLASIGIVYRPARAWKLGCRYSYEKRASDSSISYPYSANEAGCSAQFLLQ